MVYYDKGAFKLLYNCKGVIFDFNGTLFFDSEKHVLAWEKMAKELRGFGIGVEEMQKHFYGVPNNRAIEYILQKKCAEEELTRYSELKEAYYREFCKEDKESFHLVDGCHEFFEQLVEESIPFTIASASIKPNIDFFVESFELQKWFDPVKIVYDDGSFENKVKMFRDVYGDVEIDEFYTDSMSDKPMMDISKTVFLVDGEKLIKIKKDGVYLNEKFE